MTLCGGCFGKKKAAMHVNVSLRCTILLRCGVSVLYSFRFGSDKNRGRCTQFIWRSCFLNSWKAIYVFFVLNYQYLSHVLPVDMIIIRSRQMNNRPLVEDNKICLNKLYIYIYESDNQLTGRAFSF